MLKKTIWVLYFTVITGCLYGQTDELSIIQDEIQQLTIGTDSILNDYFDRLKRIGLDTMEKTLKRREALILIGKLETEESIRFLIDNIATFLFAGPYDGDITIYLEHPCYYALLKDKDKWWCWRLIPYVLESLNQEEKDKEEIRWLAKIFKCAFKSNKHLISQYLEARMRPALPPLKENLKKIHQKFIK